MPIYIGDLLILSAFATSTFLAGYIFAMFKEIRRVSRKLKLQVKEFSGLIEQYECMNKKLHVENANMAQRLDNIDAWRTLNNTSSNSNWRK